MEGFQAVADGFQGYLRVKGYSGRSVTHYRQHLKGFFGWLEGQGMADVKAVSKGHLKAYRVTLGEWRSQEGEPYSWSTVAVKVQAVRRLFEWLEGSGQILVNPAEGLPQGKAGDRLPRRILTPEEVGRMLEVPDLTKPDGVRDRAILEVFYSTGIRLAELTGLGLTDLDWVGGAVRVNGGKGAKDRVVPIGGTAGRWVKEYVTKWRRHLAKDRNEGRYALWVNKYGWPLSALLVGRMVKECGAKAGVGEVTPHILRHTFATQLVRNGASVEAVAKMLGHSNLKVTHKYVRVAGADLKATHGKTHPREKDKEAVGAVELEGVAYGHDV